MARRECSSECFFLLSVCVERIFLIQNIQRRLNGKEDFERTWTEYKSGFGDLAGEHWLGNDNIQILTKPQKQQVKIHLQSSDGETVFAEYSDFWIGDESTKFQLHIDGFSASANIGVYFHHSKA